MREPVRQRQQRQLAGHPQPAFADAEARTVDRVRRGAPRPWQDPREDGALPDIYIAMGQTAENVAQMRGITRAEQDEFGVRSQNLAEKAIADGFWQRDITPSRCPDGTVVSADDGPRRGHHAGEGGRAAAGVPPGRHGHRRELLPAQRRRRRGRGHERPQGRRPRHHPAGEDRGHRGVRAVTGDHGPRPGGASRQALARAGMAIDDIDLVEINEAFAAQVIPSYQRPWHRHRQAERQRRGDRGRAPVRHDRRADHLHAAQQPAFHDKTFGLETMCVGGGQGMAMIVERLS